MAVFVSLFGYLEYSVYREVALEKEVLNANGIKTALVYYHPGLTDYARNITYTYAEALASNGWRVEVATVSSQAPTDLSKYSLLVLSWAIYDFNPAPTVTNQLHRIGNLNGIQTVIITIGGGLNLLNAPASMNKIVQDANGTIVQSITCYRSQHNQAQLADEASLLKL